jgi:hypothetical protein
VSQYKERKYNSNVITSAYEAFKHLVNLCKNREEDMFSHWLNETKAMEEIIAGNIVHYEEGSLYKKTGYGLASTSFGSIGKLHWSRAIGGLPCGRYRVVDRYLIDVMECLSVKFEELRYIVLKSHNIEVKK